MENRSRTKFRIPADLHYACLQCGRCCRRWYAPVDKAEADRIQRLDWQQAGADIPSTITVSIRGKRYLAHRENGDCIFLDPASGLCRIHGQYGATAKPAACRLYPLSFQRTFGDEISINLRFDCPAVQQQHGPRLRPEQHPEICEYSNSLNPGPAFDTDDTAGLSREGVELIIKGARDLIQRRDLSPADKSLTLMNYKRRAHGLGPTFINDIQTMNHVMPSFIERTVNQVREKRFRPAGLISRAIFRQWLVLWLRRDEDIRGQGLHLRIARVLATMKLTAGFGSFRAVGTEHPDNKLEHTSIFRHKQKSPHVPDAAVTPEENTTELVTGGGEPFALYWQFVDARLYTMQFFGPAAYGKGFFDGLRMLIQTYPLVLSAARYHAGARGRLHIETADIAYGVGAIDHSFGKCPPVQAQLLHSFEKYFDSWRYGLLLQALGEE